MSLILIGSRALAIRAPRLLSRQCIDFDWICTESSYYEWLEKNSSKLNIKKTYEITPGKMVVEGDSICEFEFIKSGHSSELFADIVSKDKYTINSSFGLIPSLNALFALKDTHKFKKFQTNQGHSMWWKTARDWHAMKIGGAQIPDLYTEFVNLRTKETLNYKHPSLMQSKNNFFKDDNITYIYDHDDIHKSVCMYEEPAYLKYMKDGSEVMSDKNKFFACPRNIQLAGVIEEACTLSIERAMVINHPNKMTPAQGFMYALAKICTSITSGFFRQFAFENVFDILKLYPENYWNNFQQDVASGKIRKINTRVI